MMKQGMKSLGGRMRSDLGEEVEQAKYDFEEQARLEGAAENRGRLNSQYLQQNPNNSQNMSASNLKAKTPMKYEHEGPPNGSPQGGNNGGGSGSKKTSSFIDQFKSDPKPAGGNNASGSYNLNQSMRGSKRDPIPIGGGDQSQQQEE